MKKLLIGSVFGLLSGYAISGVVADAPLVSIATHDAYFKSISQLCGKAFVGKVVSNNVADSSFASKRLVMHENAQSGNCKSLFMSVTMLQELGLLPKRVLGYR